VRPNTPPPRLRSTFLHREVFAALAGTIQRSAATAPATFRRPRAFTLLEMLVVIAIIAILAAVVVPAVAPVLRSSQMNTAGAMLVDELNFARQTALTMNRDVEVRFYQLVSTLDPKDKKYRAVQCLAATDRSTVKTALGNLKYLPEPVIISDEKDKSGNIVSTLLDHTNTSLSGLTRGQETISGVADPVSYVSFLFRATGGTNLAPVTATAGSTTGNWYLTLYLGNASRNATTGIPDNYFTVQIDPVTGRTRVYRP
jgi:uncharacterized protein (TIGR02596 family)